MFNGRRQPSCGGTSRMTRECQVRICERLGVKFPGPTRHSRRFRDDRGHVRFTPDSHRYSGRPVLPSTAELPAKAIDAMASAVSVGNP